MTVIDLQRKKAERAPRNAKVKCSCGFEWITALGKTDFLQCPHCQLKNGHYIKDEDNEPHNRGPARCLDCKHEWEAIAHHEAVWLECPKCSLLKGRFIGHHVTENKIWICNCGNDLFFISPNGCFCPNCGEQCRFP